jgi:hypothetical protein
VVYVRVREKHNVDRGRVESERLAILAISVTPALERAGIDQKARVSGIVQIA